MQRWQLFGERVLLRKPFAHAFCSGCARRICLRTVPAWPLGQPARAVAVQVCIRNRVVQRSHVRFVRSSCSAASAASEFGATECTLCDPAVSQSSPDRVSWPLSGCAHGHLFAETLHLPSWLLCDLVNRRHSVRSLPRGRPVQRCRPQRDDHSKRSGKGSNFLPRLTLLRSQGYWRSSQTSFEFLRCLSSGNVRDLVKRRLRTCSLAHLLSDSASAVLSISNAERTGWALCANFARCDCGSRVMSFTLLTYSFPCSPASLLRTRTLFAR
jgi:hypothetical protein